MPTAGSRSRAGAAARAQLVIGRTLPFLVVLLTALADVFTPDRERFDRLLVAAPPLAAVTWGVRGTIGIGLLAMAVRVLLSFNRGGDPLPEPFASETVLAIVTAASAWASRVRTRREQELRDLTAVAEVVQRVVLRPLPHRLGRFELHLLYVAAAAKAQVGGDFYEAVRIPGAVRVMLGDVQGMGLGAVETASVLLGAFRAAVHDAPDLAALADRLDAGLARHDPRDPGSDAAERFATVVLVELPDDRDVARFLSLGHPTPFLQHGNEVEAVRFAAPSLPVNLTGLADSRHRIEEVPFGPGDRMLLYTDGVSEARDRNGVFYPVETRMREGSREPAPEFLARLHRDLVAHSAGGLGDDVAALLVVRPADAP